MKITYFSSTQEVLAEMGRRIKAARVAMAVTQEEMAELTHLSQRTISSLENGKDAAFSTVIEVLRALGMLQSMELMLPEQPVRPSQLARLGKTRERVRAKKETSQSFRWGDEA